LSKHVSSTCNLNININIKLHMECGYIIDINMFIKRLELVKAVTIYTVFTYRYVLDANPASIKKCSARIKMALS
jgi:hypothetical protein